MNLQICKLHPQAITPTHGSDGAACFDLYAIDVSGGGDYKTAICRTGLAFEVPEGHAMMIFSRSGHGFNKDTRLANCVGVIDSDYRGEVMVKLTKDAAFHPSEVPALIARAGDRVAQAMVIPVPRVTFHVVEQLSLTERGAAGFGSTGQA